MKAFLFSDLHCSNKQLANLYDFVIQDEEISLMIFAGDVVNMGEPVWFAEKFIQEIQKLELPFMWVPGNNDFGRAYYKVNSAFKSVESKIVESCGRCFTGVGGSPASWAGQYAGESMIDKKEIGGTIFISHFPPPVPIMLNKGDLEFSSQTPNSAHKLASKHFKDAPLVHICGHLHYKWGTALLGQTKIIQLGSLEVGHYAIMDLDNLSVKFKRF